MKRIPARIRSKRRGAGGARPPARLAAVSLLLGGLIASIGALASGAGVPPGGPYGLTATSHSPALSARFGFRAASPVTARPRTTFAGNTSDESPIVVKVSRDGRRVRALAIHWDARCTSGQGFPFGDVLLATRKAKPAPGAPVSGNPYFGKRISTTGRFEGTSLSTLRSDTLVAKVTQEITGKLGQTKGSGTWKAHVEVSDSQSGQGVDSCDTGTLRWTAPAPQTAFFGGITSQLEPVVVQLSRNLRQVRLLRIGWAAPCNPQGGFAIGDALRKFPLMRGRFGERFSERYPREGGGSSNLDYEVTGKIGRKRASGTFRARYTEVDAGGITTGDCLSPKIRWRANR